VGQALKIKHIDPFQLFGHASHRQRVLARTPFDAYPAIDRVGVARQAFSVLTRQARDALEKAAHRERSSDGPFVIGGGFLIAVIAIIAIFRPIPRLFRIVLRFIGAAIIAIIFYDVGEMKDRSAKLEIFAKKVSSERCLSPRRWRLQRTVAKVGNYAVCFVKIRHLGPG
jgi:hypothetical protein